MKSNYFLVVGVCLLFGASIVQAGQRDDIVKLCHTQLDAGETICNCIGDRADSDLNSDERSLLISMLSKDKKKSGELRKSLPVDSVTRAGMFMASTPATCARQKNNSGEQRAEK